MADHRDHLPEGTRICFESGNVYEIIAAPVGQGGGSLIYPAHRLYRERGELVRDGIVYALKECYPCAAAHPFTRTQTGEIVPQQPLEADIAYLNKVREMQLSERQTTQHIYRTGTRLLPILEASDQVQLALPGQPYAPVHNAYTAMESLTGKGRSLAEYMKELKRMAPEQVFGIIRQVLFAVREIHRADYLHLDIQMGNIFIKGTLEDESGVATMIDFGSARPLVNGKTQPVTDRVLFTTQGFSAPEILLHNDGTLQLGPEADLYSVGCLILYLLTGGRYDSNQLLHNKTGKYLSAFALRRIACPRHLIDRMQEVISHALEPDPERRYHSADEMLADVNDLVNALRPYRSALSAVTYDAFIAYKHAPTDQKVALTLQRLLEEFRAPRGMAERGKPFRRVFLDEGELSSCANFGEQIHEALKNSSWLIVICSPEAAQSPWIELEIEVFLKYHDRSRILALLIEGEKTTALPKPLLGSGIDDEVFAAHAMGPGPKKICRQLRRDALLKIVAPMLGTTYDALRQRRKIRTMQRVAATTCVGIVAALAFSGYALVQNRRIEAEYRHSLISQSQYLAELAKDEYARGDPAKAIEIALSALPSPEQSRPVVAGAEYALSRALNVYTLPSQMYLSATATGLFQHPRTISRFFADFDADILFACDVDRIYFWNIPDCSSIKILEMKGRVSIFHSGLLNTERRLLLFADASGLHCYDYEHWTYRWEYAVSALHGAQLNQDTVLLVTDTEVLGLDLLTGEEVYRIPFDAGNVSVDCETMAVNESGTLLAFDVHDETNAPSMSAVYGLDYLDAYSDNTDDLAVVVNLKERSIQMVRPEIGDISDIHFTPADELLLIAGRGNSYVSGTGTGSSRMNYVTAALYSVGAPEARWVQTFPYGAIMGRLSAVIASNWAKEPVIITANGVNACVMLSYANKVALLDLEKGTLLDDWELTDEVVALTANNTGASVITRDGQHHILRTGENRWTHHALISDQVEQFVFGQDCMLALFDSWGTGLKSVIVKYQYAYDDRWVSLSDEVDASIYSHPIYTSDQYVVILDKQVYPTKENTLWVYQVERGELSRVALTYDPECDISTESILGVDELFGHPTVLISARDFSKLRDPYCVVCIDLDSMTQQIIYPPLPHEIYSQGIAYVGRNAYIAGKSNAHDDHGDSSALRVYSWKIGDDEARQVIAYQVAADDPLYNAFIDDIIVSPDEQSTLIITKGFQHPGLSSTMYLVDNKRNTVQPILNEFTARIYDSSKLIRWDSRGAMFSVVLENEIRIYDKKGKLQCSVPYDAVTYSPVDVSFIPKEDAFLVLLEDGRLIKYAAHSGAELCSADLRDADRFSSIWYNLSWTYFDDHLLALSHLSYSFLIDTDTETWGVRAALAHAVSYDEHTDRFYTFEHTSGDSVFGYFQRYSTEQLIEMGRRFLGYEN